MVVRPPDVVDAALEILDRYGLADLTMRRVAERLEVKAGALYWHFPNKQTLLARVSDAILAELVPPTDADWRDWTREWTLRLRDTLLAHRDAAELVSSAMATELGRVDLVGPVADRLSAAGVDAADARAASRALVHLTLGSATEQQTRATLVELGVLDAADERTAQADHRAGVDLVLAGLATRPGLT